MNHSVYIRPLQIEDANTSYEWRNNPAIWRYTGSRPDKLITPEIEREWLETVLTRENEKRFAICLSENNKYIGNIFLTDIDDQEAQIHIFIGEMKSWGEGRANEAIAQLVEYGFRELHLNSVYGLVNVKNNAAIQLAASSGFKKMEEIHDPVKNVVLAKMVMTRG